MDAYQGVHGDNIGIGFHSFLWFGVQVLCKEVRRCKRVAHTKNAFGGR